MAPREIQPPKTTAEIGPRREAAKKVRDDLKTALGQEGLTDAEYAAIQTQYTAAKKQYNLLDDLYGKAEKAEKKAGVASKGSAYQQGIKDTATKDKIKLAETAAIRSANIFKDDPNDKNKKNNKDAAYQTLNDLYDKADASGVVLPRIIAPIDGGGFGLVNAAAAPAAVVETAATPTVTAPRVLTAAESKALATGRTLPASTAVDTPDTATTDTTVNVKKLAADQKTFVDAQITARKLKDTPANRKLLRAEYQKTAKPADDMAWMEIFRKDYPSYSDWTTTAVTEHFGQDFIDILNTVAQGTIEYSDEELKALLRNTKYFTAVTDKQYSFDTERTGVQQELIATARRAITTDYADIGLSETDLADLSKTVARSGLTGTGLKQAVYQYAFRRAAAAPMATDTKMVTNVLQGADADAIRQSARAYGYAVSDAEVQAALTGGMYNGVAVSSESILQKAQKAAKGAYGHLSDQIDAGLSLSDIFENYKRYAANVLELDESQIDFTKDPKWQSAFGTKESGQMGLGDWVTKLKSDESFGWQFTKQANQQATDIGLTLARAFGKVK
jgi:hypothetical protein